MRFTLESEFKPTGDQPEAIRQLVKGIRSGESDQTLIRGDWFRKNIYSRQRCCRGSTTNIGVST